MTNWKTTLNKTLYFIILFLSMFYINLLYPGRTSASIDFTAPKVAVLQCVSLLSIPLLFYYWEELIDRRWFIPFFIFFVNIFCVSLLNFNEDTLLGNPFSQSFEGLLSWLGYGTFLLLGLFVAEQGKENIEKIFKFVLYGSLFNSIFAFVNIALNIQNGGLSSLVSGVRIYGLTINAVSFSNLLLLLLGIGFWANIYATDRNLKILSKISIPLITLELFLTFSRSAWLSMFILFIIYFWKINLFRRIRENKGFLAGAVVSGILVIIISSVMVSRIEMDRLSGDLVDRAGLWNNGISLIREQPLGRGPSFNDELYKYNYLDKKLTYLKDYSFFKAHNMIIDFGISFGIQGIIFLIVFLIQSFRSISSKGFLLKMTLLLYLLSMMTYYTDIYSTPLFFMIIGIALSIKNEPPIKD